MRERLTERMAEHLDIKERKIIAQLDKNCRQSITSVAKKVGLSNQLTNYHVNNLIQNKTISRFLTIFNFRKLGYDVYYVLVEFQNLTRDKEGEILKYIGNNPTIAWLITTYGKWNLVFCVMAKTTSDFNDVLRDILGKYNPFIKDHMFVIAIENIHSTKDYLLEHDPTESLVDPKMSKRDIFVPDEIDLKVMNRLYLNPRESIIDIANHTKLHKDTVASRIKRLVENKVILKFTLEINPNIINYEWHLLFLEFSQIDLKREEVLKEFLARHRNVTFITTTVGKWNLLIDFHVCDYEHLYQLIYELKDKFGDMIKSYDNVRIKQIHKCTFLPEKMFE